jgi:rhodanese-related sulfurtransferase
MLINQRNNYKSMRIYDSFKKRLALGLIVASFLARAGAAEPSPAPEPAVKHVDAKQARQLIAEKKVVVLDLRTPTEYKSGRIAGATNIDFLASDFEEHIKSLDKNKSYLIHCASGGRSSRSLPAFKKQQFQSIYHLDGGIKAWEKAGLPVEK